MKKKLYDQVLSWHGPMLGLFIEEEQGAFPRDAPATTEDRTSYQVPDSRQAHGQLQSQSKSCGSSAEILPVEFAEKLQRFIARKADLLFMDSGEHVQPSRYEIHVEDSEDEEEEGDLYAILPPLEQFMSIHSETTECRAHLYEALEANDIVVARVVNIRDFGLFVRLICLCCNKKRQVDNLEIIGLCPSSEIPAQSSHENPVNGYHVNDLLKLRVLKVEASEEKILLSLFVPKHWSGDSHVGIITESELPSQYKRSLFLADHNDSYDKMLHNILGFSNPHCVSYLTNMLGLDEKTPPSLLRALHSGKYPEKDYGESLREEQNRKWSLHNTAKGVNLFKEGRYVEAMQYFNHALQLDKYNVEALVARGALFANRDSLDKAIEDFEGALKLSSMHRNARKYLCQTLMAKAKQFEDKDDMSEAITLYEKVLTLNPGLKDAEESLRYVREKKEHFRKRQQLLEKQESQNKNPPEKKSLMEMSRDTLKKLLIAEKVKRKERKKRKKDKSKKKKEEKMKQKGESRKRRHSRKFSSDESDEMVVVEENIDMHRFSDSRHRSMEKRGKRKSRSHSKESDVMVINEGRERRNSEKSSVSGHERGHEHRSLDSSSCNSTKVEESRRKSFGGYSPELPRRFKRTISDHGFSKEKQISHDVCTPSLVKDTVKASERTYALLKVKDKYMESRSTSRRARRDSHRSEKSDDHSKSDGLIKRPRRDSQGTGQPLDLLLSGRYRDSSDSVGFSEVLCAVQSSSKTGRSYDRKVEVVKNASYDRESEGTNLHSKGKRSRHPLGCVGEAFTRKDNRYSSSDIFSDRSSHKADWCEVEDRSPTKNKPHSSTDYSSEEDYRESGSKAQSTRGHKLSRSSSFSSESRDLRRNRSSSAEYNNRKRSSTSSLEEHVKIHKNTEKQRLYPDYKASSSSKKKSLLEKTSPSDTHFGTKGRDNAGVYNKAVIQSTRLVEIPAVKSRWEDTKDLSKDVHEDKHAKLGKEVRSRYERECCEQTPKAPRGYVKENETKKERISSKEYTRTVSKLEDDDLDDMLPKAYQVNRNTNPVRQRHFGEKHSNLEKGHKYYKRETSESYKSRRHENWNQECKEKDACRSNWNKDRKRKIDDTDDARERNVGKYENQKVNRDDRKCNSFPQSSPENKKLKRGEGYDISVKDEPKRESERKDKESSKMGQSFNTLWMEVIQQYESEGSDSGNSAPSNDAREAEQKYANRDRRSYESHREYDRTWERDKSNSGNRHNSGKNKGSPEKKRYR